MKYLVMISMFLFVQSDWTENVEKSIKRVNAEGKLDVEFEKKDSEGEVKVKRYKTNHETKIDVKYKYEKFMDLDFSYYENENLLFAEIVNGKDILIYKAERKKEDPYAVLIEKITYFKNENEGISKSRKIDVYENSDIEKLKSELKKIDFKTEKIDSTEYKSVKKRCDQFKATQK
ncbi:hypothetical protein [Flavobacterium pectinovorum]|uniref:hypothetical protein n=1 Tax=Flavobacterium pectinovorum TaxID=29533 RepID=UPI001FAE20D9|nr:hypothetical protein [Flavobacterium pectinovorum]MCI9844425.1 hypothetical protein [Flavobacterium pectinovorum]